MSIFEYTSIGQFRDATNRHRAINDARRNCLGCGFQRSIGQFDGAAEYCRKCVLRGISTPKASTRNAKSKADTSGKLASASEQSTMELVNV